VILKASCKLLHHLKFSAHKCTLTDGLHGTAEGGGIDGLLRFIRGCNRSQPHVDMLKHAVAVMFHVARYQQLHSSLLASPDCVQILAEQLQLFRDKEVWHVCCNCLFLSKQDASTTNVHDKPLPSQILLK